MQVTFRLIKTQKQTVEGNETVKTVSSLSELYTALKRKYRKNECNWVPYVT